MSYLETDKRRLNADGIEYFQHMLDRCPRCELTVPIKLYKPVSGYVPDAESAVYFKYVCDAGHVWEKSMSYLMIKEYMKVFGKNDKNAKMDSESAPSV